MADETSELPCQANLLDATALLEVGEVLGGLRPVQHADGAVLFGQGSRPEGALLILDGTAALRTRWPGLGELAIGTATAGDLIGEGALIGTAPHTLTAVAMGPLSLLRIEPRHFAALCAIASPWHRRIVHHLALRLALRARSAIRLAQPILGIGSRERAGVAQAHSPGCSFDIRPFLPILPFFRGFAATEVDSFLSSAQIFELSSGAWLFTPESPADSVHIVLRGALELRLPGLQLGRRLGVLGPGRLVDCVELMLGGPRRTECQTCERSVVLRISVAAFQEALGRDDRTAFAALCATTHELIDRLARGTRLMASTGIARILGV
jgi:CRP-like cAMP-binding protein